MLYSNQPWSWSECCRGWCRRDQLDPLTPLLFSSQTNQLICALCPPSPPAAVSSCKTQGGHWWRIISFILFLISLRPLILICDKNWRHAETLVVADLSVRKCMTLLSVMPVMQCMHLIDGWWTFMAVWQIHLSKSTVKWQGRKLSKKYIRIHRSTHLVSPRSDASLDCGSWDVVMCAKGPKNFSALTTSDAVTCKQTGFFVWL